MRRRTGAGGKRPGRGSRREEPIRQAGPEPRQGFTAVGVVLRAHGWRGELRVQAFAEGAPNLQPGSCVHVAGTPHRVVRARFDRGAWLVTLEGVDSRDAAEALRGELVEVADEDLAPLEPGVYYVKDLVGLQVVTVEGDELGRLTEVLETGANDVYVVVGDRGEVLVPALQHVVVDVRLAEGVMKVDLPPGLVAGR